MYILLFFLFFLFLSSLVYPFSTNFTKSNCQENWFNTSGSNITTFPECHESFGEVYI